MSTTAKIDFDPDLFADGGPDAEHDLPTSNQPTRRTNRAPFIVIVAGSLLFVLASMAAFKIFYFSAKTRGESLGVSNILHPHSIKSLPLPSIRQCPCHPKIMLFHPDNTSMTSLRELLMYFAAVMRRCARRSRLISLLKR